MGSLRPLGACPRNANTLLLGRLRRRKPIGVQSVPREARLLGARDPLLRRAPSGHYAGRRTDGTESRRPVADATRTVAASRPLEYGPRRMGRAMFGARCKCSADLPASARVADERATARLAEAPEARTRQVRPASSAGLKGCTTSVLQRDCGRETPAARTTRWHVTAGVASVIRR